MTDNEIIKALECCPQHIMCGHCPFRNVENCMSALYVDALDLINSQKAEIESKNDLIHRQSDVISEQKEKLESIYSEATKEFAERLKESEGKITTMFLCRENITTYVPLENIDNLVKEMVGEHRDES